MIHKGRVLQKIKNEDMACLNELIELYYPDIFRYCLWHTSNRQTAEISGGKRKRIPFPGIFPTWKRDFPRRNLMRI